MNTRLSVHSWRSHCHNLQHIYNVCLIQKYNPREAHTKLRILLAWKENVSFKTTSNTIRNNRTNFPSLNCCLQGGTEGSHLLADSVFSNQHSLYIFAHKKFCLSPQLDCMHTHLQCEYLHPMKTAHIRKKVD